MTNVELATALRRAMELHEASWNGQRYIRAQKDCTREVVGDDPIAKLFDCLFTAGYVEMWDFCDEVLGP